MAERRALPPPVLASPDAASSSAVSTAFGSPLEPVAALPPPLSHPHDTYVVKVQKDQIYRVPPPENAYLAERYRAGAGASKQRSTSRSPCVMRTLGALLATAVLVGAAIAICVVVLRPGLPGFSVDGLSVSVHNAAGSNGQQRRVDYHFFLTAVNPDKMSALWYKDGGTARLTHQGTTLLAKGVVGQPADGGEDATDFSVVLHGTQQHGGHAPRAVEKGLAGSKDAVALRLTVEATVQVHIGALGFGQRRLAVDCELSAAGLKKDVHVLKQECKSVFRN
jgi:hypothetical protein